MAESTSYDPQKEAQAFDRQVEERIRLGQVPDLRRLRFVESLYNNPWREPEFVNIQIMPKVNFAIEIAKKAGGAVLELGCGMGYLSLELARNGLHVDAVDISNKSIEVAKKYLAENPYQDGFGSLNYEVADIINMDMGKNKYNSVITFGVLHHTPDLESVIKRISKALKSNGNLILCEPIRDNFSLTSAEFAAILRVVLPTWEPCEKKLVYDSEAWSSFIQEIYNEYKYVNKEGKNTQSPFDNINASEGQMIEPIKKYFIIKELKYSDAFIDKTVGGLRGPNRILLARFLKFLDDDLIRRGILPPTSMCLWAIKKA
jgi:2-polyprenyl-3-methyl-5-hydroxy-6-metoxy-1,4-benzoquinol methylase